MWVSGGKRIVIQTDGKGKEGREVRKGGKLSKNTWRTGKKEEGLLDGKTFSPGTGFTRVSGGRERGGKKIGGGK